jgi:hypothetical protein
MLNVYVTCISARLTCHPEHEHLCYDSGISHCIPIGYKCDEDQDCNDGSDEGPKVFQSEYYTYLRVVVVIVW